MVVPVFGVANGFWHRGPPTENGRSLREEVTRRAGGIGELVGIDAPELDHLELTG